MCYNKTLLSERQLCSICNEIFECLQALSIFVLNYLSYIDTSNYLCHRHWFQSMALAVSLTGSELSIIPGRANKEMQEFVFPHSLCCVHAVPKNVPSAFGWLVVLQKSVPASTVESKPLPFSPANWVPALISSVTCLSPLVKQEGELKAQKGPAWVLVCWWSRRKNICSISCLVGLSVEIKIKIERFVGRTC